ncbi:MAG TPA: hypothetical protein DIU00_23910 [Phycisphaerales bacterium]|nr:hypothetical protein [Phycisphaerales bacterium]
MLSEERLKRMKNYIVIISLALANVVIAEQTTFYISPEGNDAWSGSLSEANIAKSNGPLATLEGARKAVRARIEEGLIQPIKVLIRNGEYALDSTVVFSKEDSGTKACPISYEAYPGEKPVFTGAKTLKNWQPCAIDPAGLPEVAQGKLYTTSIPEELRGIWQITTLYDGLILLARSRSKQFMTADRPFVEDYNCQPKEYYNLKLDPETPAAVFSREIHYQNNDLLPGKNIRDIEIFLKPCHSWMVNMLSLERIDVQSRIAWFSVPPTYHLLPANPRYHKFRYKTNPYYIENSIEHLDEPGEWVFNSQKGTIYLWPKRPPMESDIRIPFLQEFIRVEGIEDKTPVRFLTFAGLTFHHGLRNTIREGDKCLQHDWEMYDKGNAIVRFRHAEDCTVRACEFTCSSGTGVRLDLHCQRITVADSLFAYLGGTGIVLAGYGPGLKDENHHNKILNNYFHHVGEIYWHSPGIFVSQSTHNLISHNTIHDVGYTGIIVSDCRPHELLLHKPLANRREWISTFRLDECLPFIEKAWKQEEPRDMENFLPLLHSRNNRIEYNEIYNVMLLLGDGNGLYFSAMGKNNRVYRNYFHNIAKGAGSFRLDDDTTFAVFEENVSINCNKWCEIKGPVELINNFAINNHNYIQNTPYLASGERNVYYNDDPKLNPGFKTKAARPNEEMAAKSKEGVRKEGAFLLNAFWTFLPRCENSLVFLANTPEGVKPGDDLVTDSRRGDAKVGMLYADPLFDKEAMKQKIFRFRDDSPAKKLGIKEINLSEVGSTLAKYTR